MFQWEQKVDKGQEDFEVISKNIRKEMARFEKQRVRDFRNTIIHYLESLMNNQQQVSTVPLCHPLYTGKLRPLSPYSPQILRVWVQPSQPGSQKLVEVMVVQWIARCTMDWPIISWCPPCTWSWRLKSPNDRDISNLVIIEVNIGDLSQDDHFYFPPVA